MSAAARHGLVSQITAFLGRGPKVAASPVEPEHLNAAAAHWATRRTIAITDQERRRRLRAVAARLQHGDTSEITLGDLRLALFSMREEPVFANSTINRHRLISEAVTRRGRTPVNMLFNAFFRIFEPGSSETKRVYDHLGRYRHELRPLAQRFTQDTRFFDGEYGIPSLIENFDLSDPSRSLARAGLTEALQDTAYGFSVKCLILDEALARREIDERALSVVLGWIELGPSQRADLESALYLHLLSPFFNRDPEFHLSQTICRFLIERFGDPRHAVWPKLPDDKGRFKRDKCIAVMERWLEDLSAY